jgi:phosphoglycerol transferase MdoB-like AlkP superfamily enzyme
LPSAWKRRLHSALAAYFALALTLLVLLEAISFDFIEQYDVRPNYLFIENLGGSSEVLRTIWTQYHWHVLGVVAITGAAGCLALRLARGLLVGGADWTAARRVAALLLLGPLLFLGVRGTFDRRPLNAAMVAFSGQNLVNQLVLNSTYTAAEAWLDRRGERSAGDLYGRMSDAEVLERVARYTNIDAADRRDGAVPFLHVQHPREQLAHPRNLVIVLEESLGAEFVGCLGGLPLTPEFDALARQGLLLEKLYCTGTRTVRGIEAVVTGFLPTPGSGVVKLVKSQSNFFTIAALLKQHGYATDFVYGGESHFDNMAAFFLANGFDRALSESDYEHPVFRGTWGVSDEDLMRKANDTFVAHGDRPFFALVLSTSNHAPYEFPDGRIRLHDADKASRNNTVEYADYAIGELFRRARKERYFANTEWIVVADHDERTYGGDLIPVDKFHIPGLILGPGVAPGTFDRVASQIDLVPTALDLLGLECEHPMIGRNLFALAPDDPGRAVLQFNDVHALLVGNRVAVHPGAGAPRCFTFDGVHLQPAPHDRELERDAQAHALLPSLLYEKRLYPTAP